MYKEHEILVDKEVSIIGEDGVVIDGEKISNIMYVSADNFVLKNVKVINVGVSYTKDNAAIKIHRVKISLLKMLLWSTSFSVF